MPLRPLAPRKCVVAEMPCKPDLVHVVVEVVHQLRDEREGQRGAGEEESAARDIHTSTPDSPRELRTSHSHRLSPPHLHPLLPPSHPSPHLVASRFTLFCVLVPPLHWLRKSQITRVDSKPTKRQGRGCQRCIRWPRSCQKPVQRKKALLSENVTLHTVQSGETSTAPLSRMIGVLVGQQHSNPLEEHFDLFTTTLPKTLLSDFTSPPLLPGLKRKGGVGSRRRADSNSGARSLKHLMKEPGAESKWKEYLLVSETGSSKSMAYLLPLLQDLKRTELESAGAPRKSSPRPSNPRTLVLAPTHELLRQLAGFAKKVYHIIKLRILCASIQSTTKNKTTTEVVFDNCDTGDVMVGSGGRFNRELDVLVGTPMKLLELGKGKGWNWEQGGHERALRAGSKKTEDPTVRKFWVDEPEMGLENIEWVLVDEADVLFDPDFEASTRQLLADIAAAKGQPVPVLPVSPVSLSEARPTPESPQPISYYQRYHTKFSQ
ncbi:hypothetical protein JVT61DRAFT_15066 [Boletus reticuloceps]|uniref:ATP-dependent RNA helicase n=1 Tax=Boletus reticuloceps TaxID=495285 RepID=A0A8I3A9W7_9AGAM|nr:hypothetical protein JVT61DRAFT_15066 [Boletus reticuloceps]